MDKQEKERLAVFRESIETERDGIEKEIEAIKWEATEENFGENKFWKDRNIQSKEDYDKYLVELEN